MNKTCIVAGTFDYNHIGHIRLFEKARRIVGDSGYIICLVNSDEFVFSYKGRYPVQSDKERLAKIRKSKLIDQAFLLPCYSDQKDILNNFAPISKTFDSALLVLTGSDWAAEDKDIFAQFGITEEWAEEKNIQFVFVPRTKGISSTQLRQDCSEK